MATTRVQGKLCRAERFESSVRLVNLGTELLNGGVTFRSINDRQRNRLEPVFNEATKCTALEDLRKGSRHELWASGENIASLLDECRKHCSVARMRAGCKIAEKAAVHATAISMSFNLRGSKE